MASLVVNPTNYNITDVNENSVKIYFNTDVTLNDIKLSTNNGQSFINNINMSQSSASFDISHLGNNNYTCLLKGYYEEIESGGGSGGTTNYYITNNLTNCTNSNTNSSISSGSSYSATITANSGYTMNTIIVTMGGSDITNSVVSGNNIYIGNVTGNLVITANATEISVPIEPTSLEITNVTAGTFTINDPILIRYTTNKAVTKHEFTTKYGTYNFANGTSRVTSSGNNHTMRFNAGEFNAGTMNWAIRVTDANGNTAIAQFTLVITDGSATSYTITNNLTNCTSSNSVTNITAGSSYSATITANSGYDLSAITVTMGGSDITNSVVSGNNIYIGNVTGNIVITANATQQQTGGGGTTGNGITTSKNNYTIPVGTGFLEVPVTITANLPSYPVWEVRQNGSYFLYCYKSGNNINVDTSSLGTGIYDNLTIVAKENNSGSYIDVATSNTFSITVGNGSSSGGSGGSTTPISINYINNINVSPNTSFEITYSTNTDATKHEISYDEGKSFVQIYPNSSGTTYKFMHEGVSSQWSEHKRIIRVTDSNGNTATSNKFSIYVNSSGGSTPSSGDDILAYMYPMPQNHECIPNGAPSDWKYQSRWENKDKPAGWSAFGGWAQVYRVEGTPFTQNTGVEIKDYKVYGWKNGQWHSVIELPYPSGNFYAEDFTDDANSYFSQGIKPSDDRRSVIIRLTSDMTVSTSRGTKYVCYHPFTAQLDYDADFEYIFTCVSMRKVKWDASGVDDINTTRYCASCGGDWWRQKGLTWAPDWSNNKGIAQPKITEVTTDWKVFAMTTVPQGWSNGFPVDTI